MIYIFELEATKKDYQQFKISETFTSQNYLKTPIGTFSKIKTEEN